MSDITIRPYSEGDLNSIVSLWEICELSRPWNDPVKDIERKLTVQRDLFLILEKNGEILGSVMGGYDGHRGNVYYFGVHPEHQNKGLGSKIMNTLITHLESCCAPGATIGLLAAHGKESFYLKFGFEPRDGESLGLGMCRFI